MSTGGAGDRGDENKPNPCNLDSALALRAQMGHRESLYQLHTYSFKRQNHTVSEKELNNDNKCKENGLIGR